ncbi:hypothetical protein EJ110_NYTH21913 [Nymphaea thermarum]|nr:hypothetical protein EJ110_NYTH21913 [Nymphaea thermarum]
MADIADRGGSVCVCNRLIACYSGDHDAAVPFVGTRRWVASLNYTVNDAWRSWWVDGQIAGFTISYDHDVTFATLKAERNAQVGQLDSVWGHSRTRHLSVAMTALAFLYRGLTSFTVGDIDFVEGSTYALQLWFLKHGGSQASLSKNTDRALTVLEQYRRLIEQLNEGDIIWHYCDRRESPSRYTNWRNF